MSKRQRDKRSSRYYLEGLFLRLPRELWQRLIYPLVGLNQLMATASVSREWMAQIFASINELSRRTVSFGAMSLANCKLTKGYLTQLCNLSAMQVDLDIMRPASVFAGLPLLSSLKTLCLCGETLLAKQVARLTQLTALDDCTRFGGTEQALMPSSLCLLRVARSQPSYYHLNNLVHLTNLTYLDLRHSSMYMAQRTLTALTALQFLAMGRGFIESYDFLTRMRDLVFLNLNNFSGCYYSNAPSAGQMTQLTALTSLSVVGTFMPLTVVQQMTQLRSLEIGDTPTDNDTAALLFRDCITLDALSWDVMATLTHVQYMSYDSQNIFQRLVPLKTLEYKLHQCSNELEEVNAFRGWKHPLPVGYFSRSLPHEHESRFLNGQAFI